MKWIGYGILAIVLLPVLRLYLRQRAIIFRPTRESLGSPSHFGIAFEDFLLTCVDGVRIHCWWIEGRQNEKAVIFFPGTVGNKTHELSAIKLLQAMGAGLLVIDYPGYGQSESRPSETRCYRAADAAWQFVTGAKGYDEQNVILYGRSLGSAMATYLAAKHRCGGLVFHSGFTSIPGLAFRRYPYLPVHLFCHTRMNSLRRIAKCSCSVLLLHSESDEFIPIGHADRIYTRLRQPKRFVRFRGGHHSNEWEYNPQVRTALAELLAGRTRRWEGDHTTRTAAAPTAAPAASNDDAGSKTDRARGQGFSG